MNTSGVYFAGHALEVSFEGMPASDRADHARDFTRLVRSVAIAGRELSRCDGDAIYRADIANCWTVIEFLAGMAEVVLGNTSSSQEVLSPDDSHLSMGGSIPDVRAAA
jgi:hypothetical protein